MRLECSHFVPTHIAPGDQYPCVVYVHGNCSSRLEVLPSVRRLLQRNLTVFCLDLSGSGWSDGEFISLGHFEQQDLRAVLDYLRSCSYVSSIGLWGRSMGAVTAILRASEDPDIAACVLDSPFASLRQVAEELVASKKITLPSFLTGLALQLVRGEVQARAGFDIDTLCPIDVVHKVIAPVLFAVATDDNFVLPHHTEDLCSKWGGPERTIMQVGGSHNTSRPSWFRDAAAAFLGKRLWNHKKAGVATGDHGGTPRVSLAVKQTRLEHMPVPVPIGPTSATDQESAEAVTHLGVCGNSKPSQMMRRPDPSAPVDDEGPEATYPFEQERPKEIPHVGSSPMNCSNLPTSVYINCPGIRAL